MGLSSRGLFAFIARLGRPPAADSDADLLERFVHSADDLAFTGIVRRHGPMVLAVCRRRLGHDADAEDAFQAVFLALAKSAAAIGRRESLPGWLYRVAYLVSLKAAGRRSRHPSVALPVAEVSMPNPPTHPVETEDLKGVLDTELARLPDKFRSVVVLCLIEGRTNAEAAAMLAVPVGTIDSRLNAARKKLQAALTRRGVAVTVGATLGQMLGGPIAATGGPGFVELVSHTVHAVLAEAAGPGTGAISPAVTELARGVATMTTMNVRLLAALGVALGLLGTAGAGIYYAAAADKPMNPEVTAAEPQPPTTPPTSKSQPATPDAPITDVILQESGAGALAKPFGVKVPMEGASIEEVLDTIEKQTDLIVRVDVAAFRRVGAIGPDSNGGENANQFLSLLYQTKAVLPRRAEKLPMGDVLADALAQAQVMHPCTYQIRGQQLVIIPAYIPPVRPGVDALDQPDEALLPARQLNEQIYGGVVSIAANQKPLAEILADLRKQTGANIVLDPRCTPAGNQGVLTVTLSDARLYDALRVIADMADLKMVYAGNIYYVTTSANASTFQPPPPRLQLEPLGMPQLGQPPRAGK